MNGVGSNFLFVGATALVTICYRPNERAKAQAMNDFLVFGTTATAGFFAGFLQERLGSFPLNWASIALIAVAVSAVAWLRVQERRPAELWPPVSGAGMAGRRPSRCLSGRQRRDNSTRWP